MKKTVNERASENSLGYILYTPETITDSTPLIVFLHGAGERGNGQDELDRINGNALPKYISNGAEYPAYVLCPQCAEGFVWNNNVFKLKTLIDEVMNTYKIKKVAITGISMGGYGTWEMGMCYPGFFSCLAPVCGGGLSWRTYILNNEKIWAFHGDSDNVVPVNNSIEMVDCTNKHGGNAKLTIYPENGHDAWSDTYSNPELYKWFLQHINNNEFELKDNYDNTGNFG